MEEKKYSVSDLDELRAEYFKQTNILEDSESDINKFINTMEEHSERLNANEYAILQEHKELVKKFQIAKEDLLNAYKASIKEIEDSLSEEKNQETDNKN